MSKALNQISKLLFTRWIGEGRLPRRFTQPIFTLYNGETDPVEHASHFNLKVAVHSKNEALICKVFPSSLGPVMMRWFDGLKAGSIDFFKELTQTFDSRFITCNRAPRPLASLLSLSMREGETLKTYSDRYWEIFNEIDGDFEDVAISTFKLSLPFEHGLRKSLTGKPITSIRQLMDRIDKYKRGDQSRSGAQENASTRPPLGTINVIFATPGRTGSHPARVIFVARSSAEDPNSELKKARLEI
ncbi:uncharacterized protein LOC115966659 [Quercus lobata]|uniref:uncharacterized protein LOC115966659 n=1 Tax=Quercus lobata TaxID=97700 RepID=UPI0012445BC9|nr:uncharacterized protein LOC115966659 [Quercus lobata]